MRKLQKKKKKLRYSNTHYLDKKMSKLKSKSKRKKKTNEGLIADKKSEKTLLSYDPKDSRFDGLHPESVTLMPFKWEGLLTIKIHSDAYSKDDCAGIGTENRLVFLNHLMKDLRRKLGIADREFNWYACEEFGFFGKAHIHVIFSFDVLREKGRMDKLKILDFSELGQFYKEVLESANFVALKLKLDSRCLDINWKLMWDNQGLVNYFCKKEYFRHHKNFFFSKYWVKKGLLKAA